MREKKVNHFKNDRGSAGAAKRALRTEKGLQE